MQTTQYCCIKFLLYFYGVTAPSGAGPPHCRSLTITLRHTTLGRAPLDEWSARRKDLYLTTHNTDKEIDMSPAEFGPVKPVSERLYTRALDRPAAGIDLPEFRSSFFWDIARAERDGTRAETIFRLSPKRKSPFNSVGASVQSISGSRGVRISLSNAG